MKKKFFIVWFVVLLFGIHQISFVQAQTKQQSTNEEGIKQVIRDTGWELPWQTQFASLSEESKTSIKTKEIVKKKLLTQGELVTKVEVYSVPKDGKLRIRPYLCAIRNLFAYEIHKQIFAYEAHLIPISLDMNGAKTYMASVFIFYYYDDDKDGKFETLEFNSTTLRLPKWITENDSEQNIWIPN